MPLVSTATSMVSPVLARDRGPKRPTIVVSRRTILERDLRKQARDRMKALKIGQRMQGRVTEVRDYGLLVDIGEGLEGLVHLSEVSWSRGVRPQDAAKRGDGRADGTEDQVRHEQRGERERNLERQPHEERRREEEAELELAGRDEVLEVLLEDEADDGHHGEHDR